MYYYKFESSSPFCGTDKTDYIKEWNPLSEDDKNNYDTEIRQELYDDYGYLINGFNEADPTEEEYDDFIAGCSVVITEITKEEYDERYE